MCNKVGIIKKITEEIGNWLQSQLRCPKKNVTLQKSSINRFQPWIMFFFHIIFLAQNDP
jgi:hypothetical protein